MAASCSGHHPSSRRISSSSLPASNSATVASGMSSWRSRLIRRARFNCSGAYRR